MQSNVVFQLNQIFLLQLLEAIREIKNDCRCNKNNCILHCILNEEMIINNIPIDTIITIKSRRHYGKLPSPYNYFRRRLDPLLILLKK